MKKLKKITGVIYRVLLVFLFIVAGLAVLSALGLPEQLRLFVVQSGSMEPAVKVGSLVVVRPAEEYMKNEIITFKAKPYVDTKDPKAVITHRIVEVEEIGGATFYITKGDANNAPDAEKRHKDLVLGKVVLNIPYLGYPVSFAKTQTGFVLLVVIPATMIIYSEVLNIKNEAKRLIQERKKRKLSAVEKAEVAVGKEVQKTEKGLKKFFKKFKFCSKGKK